jgi:hypothetical protein
MKNTAARKRKQIPEGYLVVGVDPHKKRHAAGAITQDFATEAKFKFDNTSEGLEMMLDRCNYIAHGKSRQNIALPSGQSMKARITTE